MEFDINSFALLLIDKFYTSKQMPDMGGAYVNRLGYIQTDASKHSKRPSPRALREQIKKSMINSFQRQGDNIIVFDIGNEEMEKHFPYYHILQQAPVIRVRGKGTAKTKGSQMFEKNIGKRDYEEVYWNGKTFTKEYSRNVRGSRINLSRTMMHIDNEWLNTGSNQYLNMNYQYIDRINDEIAPLLANEFGMKLARKQDSGLIDEFAYQQGTTVENILDIFGSFM